MTYRFERMNGGAGIRQIFVIVNYLTMALPARKIID